MIFSPLFLPVRHAKKYSPEIACFLKEKESILGVRVLDEYDFAYDFLMESIASENNYKSIRTELCIYLNWLWVRDIAVKDVNRKDIMDFIEFCNSPPTELVTGRTGESIVVNQSKDTDDLSVEINENWAPFYNSKIKLGLAYQRLPATMNKQLSILSTFYTYLNDIEFTLGNPVAIAIRRLNPNNVANLGIESEKERSLSQVQIDCIFSTIESLCIIDPIKYERTRFLFYILVLLYPRRSEIAARPRYSPSFSDFKRHTTEQGDIFYTFYIPRSKGGKSRSVMVSSMLLEAVKRYRTFIGLTPLPSPLEKDVPLFVRHKQASHGRQAGVLQANLGEDQIAFLIQDLFSLTAEVLIDENELEQAEDLKTKTVHSLRHFGISNDLFNGRTAQEVCKCSGHSLQSIETYISSRVELRMPNVNLKDRIFK